MHDSVGSIGRYFLCQLRNARSRARARWTGALAWIVLAGCAATARPTATVSMPEYQPDRSFPQLPNDWSLGNVSDVAVDRHDNVWILHRPRTVKAGRTSAPPVVEFDAAGRFLQAWGGDGSGYDWPDAEHNIFVDQKSNVWISGSSPSGQSRTTRSDDMLLKFTAGGRFLLQIGGRSVSHGSTDTHSVNKPGDVFVYEKTNEVYVADGYGNRRVIVFDADTGAFRRMWGAFGTPPADDASRAARAVRRPTGGGPRRGRPRSGRPRGARHAGPGTTALCEPGPRHRRLERRHRVRRRPPQPAGTAVHDRGSVPAPVLRQSCRSLARQRQCPRPVARRGPAMAVYGRLRKFARRRGQSPQLEILGQFGDRGAAPGDFQGIHQLAVDSHGTLYTAEVAPGARVQKFTLTRRQ